MTQEMKFSAESDAHQARRADISAGRCVSLIALDPARGLYVYDRIAL